MTTRLDNRLLGHPSPQNKFGERGGRLVGMAYWRWGDLVDGTSLFWASGAVKVELGFQLVDHSFGLCTSGFGRLEWMTTRLDNQLLGHPSPSACLACWGRGGGGEGAIRCASWCRHAVEQPDRMGRFDWFATLVGRECDRIGALVEVHSSANVGSCCVLIRSRNLWGPSPPAPLPKQVWGEGWALGRGGA